MDFLIANLNITAVDKGEIPSSQPATLPLEQAAAVTAGAGTHSEGLAQVVEFKEFFGKAVIPFEGQDLTTGLTRVGDDILPVDNPVPLPADIAPSGQSAAPLPVIAGLAEAVPVPTRDGGALPGGGKTLPDEMLLPVSTKPVAGSDLPVSAETKSIAAHRFETLPDRALAKPDIPREMPPLSKLVKPGQATEDFTPVLRADEKPIPAAHPARPAQVQSDARIQTPDLSQLRSVDEPIRPVSDLRVATDSSLRVARSGDPDQPLAPGIGTDSRKILPPVANRETNPVSLTDPVGRVESRPIRQVLQAIDLQHNRLPRSDQSFPVVLKPNGDRPLNGEVPGSANKPAPVSELTVAHVGKAAPVGDSEGLAKAATPQSPSWRAELQVSPGLSDSLSHSTNPARSVPDVLPADPVPLRSAESAVSASSVTSTPTVSPAVNSPPQVLVTPLTSAVQAEALNPGRHADATEWGNGLGERVSWMINQKQNSATIRLDPPVLGKLDVQVRIAEDSTLITIQTQHAQTREIVESASHRLRDYLQENGYQNVNVDVSQRQDNAQTRGQPTGPESEPTDEDLAGDATRDSADLPSSQHYVTDGLIDTFA